MPFSRTQRSFGRTRVLVAATAAVLAVGVGSSLVGDGSEQAAVRAASATGLDIVRVDGELQFVGSTDVEADRLIARAVEERDERIEQRLAEAERRRRELTVREEIEQVRAEREAARRAAERAEAERQRAAAEEAARQRAAAEEAARQRAAEQQSQAREQQATEAASGGSSSARSGDSAPAGVWDQLAACESGGNWAINTGNGYYGGLQFSLSSWRAVGGSGYPHQASKAEQIRRGQMLQARQGWGAWPSCSSKLGLR